MEQPLLPEREGGRESRGFSKSRGSPKPQPFPKPQTSPVPSYSRVVKPSVSTTLLVSIPNSLRWEGTGNAEVC